MPIPSISFLAGLVVLGYLFTFVVFAILRVLTGISIQRVGYSGFRRIAFSPKHGIRVTVRGVGLSPHRPTFALPTWCSLVVTELVVSVDLRALGEGQGKKDGGSQKSAGEAGKDANESVDGSHESKKEGNDEHGKLWRKLMEVKEKIKRLHRKIHWLRLVDLVADAAEFNVVGVGGVRIERATLSVDTRSQTVDRSRLFQHYKAKPEMQRPAEWKSVVRSVLFTLEGKESTEILDYCTLNIHGLLHRQLEGLRDASIALKLGRLNVPWDDIEMAKKSAEMLQGKYAQAKAGRSSVDESILDALDELENPGTREKSIVQAVSDSRAFIASILRGIQEVQVAVSFFGLSKKLAVRSDSGKDVYFNLAMKEVGMDVLRLDPKTPAHRMYFSQDAVAHQGLLTAIAISAGIDDGHEHPERMLYVPMITATLKTTLPARTIHFSKDDGVRERNANILYANFVCTSPSVDLDPKHLPMVLEILKRRESSPQTQPAKSNSHRIISQLLPKANVKLSIQEPVIRVSLPPMDKDAEEGDYDLLISTVSSMSLELESSHSQDDRHHYGLASNYRHTSHQLYYQTAASERHDLMQSDTVEFKVDVNAIPNAAVTASGRFQTCTIFLVRPDICEGVRQIVEQLRKNVLSKPQHSQGPQLSFLRRMPAWLQYFKLEGHDFALQLAGVDEQVSKDTRGFSLELESWTTEYKAHRDDVPRPDHRRRSSSRVSMGSKSSHSPARSISGSDSPRKRKKNPADGRRLTLHLQNLDGLIIDSIDRSHPDQFMSLPRFEVAFSTSTDSHGPLFHVNSHAKSLMMHYSLYNHFAIGVAVMVIRRTFLERERAATPTHSAPPPPVMRPHLKVPGSAPSQIEMAGSEIMTIDFKASLVQVKATMPSDPPMMLQIFALEAGRHRWATPFLRTRLARLYVRAPATSSAWSRIISIKTLRLDLRDLKRRLSNQVVTEKTLDIFMETIRIGVPHQLVVHSIFDNFANIIKITKQMNHHFVTGTSDYVLTKEPEGPKNVPRISLRTQIFIFEIEDSSFEWKLGAIYRSGLQEQKQRLARDDVFRVKEKRLGRGARAGSRLRAQSAHLGDRSTSHTRQSNQAKRRSRSIQPGQNTGSHRSGRRRVRYDTEGQCGISDKSQLSIDQAKEKLHRLNAQTWKSRIDRVLNFQRRAITDIRASFWGMDEIPDEIEQHEPIMALSQRPALLAVAMNDLAITVDKPSFPMENYPKFLNDVGKGMPPDMKYGLLLPMNVHITTGEARVQLRDYPLPLLHVPSLANGQSPRLPSLSMRTNFVIAEEFRDIESQRDVDIVVVPKDKISTEGAEPFMINVRRTISPVKTYSDMKFEIHTSLPTKITWGTSYQPAIQDAMQCIEGFTKPPVDPSDRVGFWDKIRLSFHSRVNVAWTGDGDVHLVLKGSRDPYVVTGQGAGLVMVWRNDVRWNIAQHKDPRQFMTVDSGDYILAIPDFNGYARQAPDVDDSDESGSLGSSSSHKRDAVFKKVVMKLSGNVRWLAGLMFERDLPTGERSFNFKPHYEVVLKHPDFAKSSPGGEYDAYRDFRSHHIHMSIAVAAPHDRDWSVSNLKPSSNYNSVHLTPRFFSHFFSWWSMFSGIMSLPIRQGPLWGITQKKSKKFGRHIATIKYNLLLSPLFVSHIYKHKDAEEYQEDTVSATGLKMKLDSFMLDLHQRREYFDIKGHADAAAKRSSGMRINQTQVDFISADLRAVSASIAGTSAQEIEKATDETLASLHGQLPQVDMSKFTIPDNDFTWIDMDDFVELDWILPAESDPETKILPLGCAPRFTYFRQTDHGDSISGDQTRSSPFGDEPTHYCVMSAKNDPRRVQAELIDKRLSMLKEQRAENQHAEGEAELRTVQSNPTDAPTFRAKVDTIRAHGEHLKRKSHFLREMLDALTHRLEHDDPATVPELETADEFYEANENLRRGDPEVERIDSVPLADYTSDFNNRFIVHNPQIKWNNSLRNIILRYIHQNSQRRGFVYYMSRRAVKFLIDILEEQKKSDGSSTPKRQKSSATSEMPGSPEADDDATVQDRIEELLRDGRNFVKAEESAEEKDESRQGSGGPTDEIAHEFTPLNTYHFRLIAPQIQLQSEKNPKSAVLVAAKGMQLKVVQIMDKDRVNDDVSGLVQRRFTAAMDSLQMFVTSTKTFSTEFLRMYSGNKYGAKAGTTWPPWVPLEMMFEFEENPYGFNRVVHRTSASLRYDKYNTLRLKYNDDVSGSDNKHTKSDEETENRMDHVWLEFPQFRAICDSAQYFALYIIVMDLLLYSEPLEKTRSERLEKIMLASDFSDLTGAPEMVQMLQERIRQLEEIKMHFQVHEKYLDRQGWKDRITMDQDLANCEDELFFMMKAITTAQQRVEDRREQENAAGMLHLNMSANEIAWHLIRDKGESLMEFQLKNASFDRTDNNDGSNYNCMEIGRINGFNLLPNALYPEIVGPFIDPARGYPELGTTKMLRVQWLMLEAIAGIPVVDYFEVDLVPLKLQLEREVAKKVFEYIFPGVGGNAFDGGGFSPFMVKNMLPPQEEENENAANPNAATPMAEDSPGSLVPVNGHNDGTGAGTLERRLAPTLHLPKPKAQKDAKGLGISGGKQEASHHRFSIFQHSDASTSRNQLLTRSPASRQALGQTNLSASNSSIIRSPSERSLSTLRSDAQSAETEKEKRSALQRQTSKEKKKRNQEQSDDLTQMMNRASNYMTLAFVKIPSMVLCLSYKGKGQRNWEDVHDLVFRMPTLEYRNKTWSNLDLALQLKKDVIRALISHAGAIVGNKFSHHKPTRQQQSRLREIANMSSLLSRDNVAGQYSSDTSSALGRDSGEANGRPSTASERPSTMSNVSQTISQNSSPSLSAPESVPTPSGQRPATSDPRVNGNGPRPATSGPDLNIVALRRASQPDFQSPSRARTMTFSRHFTGFGQRQRQNPSESRESGGGSGADETHDTEENKRKSKLLLGGQRLLRTLRDQ